MTPRYEGHLDAVLGCHWRSDTSGKHGDDGRETEIQYRQMLETGIFLELQISYNKVTFERLDLEATGANITYLRDMWILAR